MPQMNVAAACFLALALPAIAILAPPTDPSAWTRSPSNPVLSPTDKWETSCVCENVATFFQGKWMMWYRGGWGTTAVGLAYSDDGVAWTKYAGNPVYGLGGSNVSSDQDGGQPWVTRVGNLWYMYTTNNEAPARVIMSQSPDGITWRTVQGNISLPPNSRLWGNRVMWEESSGFVMLHEAMMNDNVWRIFLYFSHDGLSWMIQNKGQPLSTMEVHPNGMYGGPRIASINGALTPYYNGAYHVFYHAVNGSGNLPTNIYHAQSVDLLKWQIVPQAAVLTHLGTGFEYDQVAGPVPLVAQGKAFLFYDGDNNNIGACKIGVALASPVEV